MFHNKACLFLAFLCLLKGATISTSIKQNFSLTKAADIKTFGAAGFEFFAIGARSFICSANFWDGVDPLMRAQSQIFEIFSHERMLSFQILDEFTTMGAHGCDYFSVEDNHFGNK